jgi:hypothetical protein
MRRLAAVGALALVLASACGGGADVGGSPAPPPAAPPPAAPAAAPAATGPTEAQLAARKALLDSIRSGDYDCYCTSAERARERAEKLRQAAESG